MSEPQPILGLGLNEPQTLPPDQVPAPEGLQFRKAETLPQTGKDRQICKACKRAFDPPYFHVNGLVVCPSCATAIESRQQAPPHQSLLKAFIYGLGAAIAGSILYAAVAIITGLELALIAILIGFMVGKSIRHASGGLGGRPQQILAVLLTYFSITTSYIPVAIHHFATQAPKQKAPSASPQATASPETAKPNISLGKAMVILLTLSLGAPFMSLTDVSGLLSLVIIFFGLQRAWRMTGRTELVVAGPYGT